MRHVAGFSMLAWLPLLAVPAVTAGRIPEPAGHILPRQSTSTTNSSSNVTVDFAVAAPVRIPSSASICATQTLMAYDFASSYASPFVGNYTPPSPSSCAFNGVVLNFTAAVRGVQYDRLAMLYLGSTEIWRTSTAEPTEAGIVWAYQKDASPYLALWRAPQTVLFELDNEITDTYTGIYNTTLTATFYVVPEGEAPVAADVILPISTLSGPDGAESDFTIPGSGGAGAASVVYPAASFPANVTKATVSIAANGQIDEEFWYSNVPTSQTDTFASTAGTLLGGGPFREVQLRIDGLLAGVVWPFPVVFTGGIVPALWRPIIGVETFDLVESEIDVTPFLPLLTDGRAHNFSINVYQVADDGGENGTVGLVEVESYWLATGKILLFYGEDDGNSTVTKPSNSSSHAPPSITGSFSPDISVASHITTTANGTNETLWYSTIAHRTLAVTSPAGTWTQTLAFDNVGYLSGGGLVQVNTQSTNGSQASTNLLAPKFDQTLSFAYPLTLYSAYGLVGDGETIDARLERGLSWTDTGRPDVSVFSLVAGPSAEDTAQTGRAYYSDVTNATADYGSTSQTFEKTAYGETYTRSVSAVNGTVVEDSAGGAGGLGRREGREKRGVGREGGRLLGVPRRVLGRGPGRMGKGL